VIKISAVMPSLVLVLATVALVIGVVMMLIPRAQAQALPYPNPRGENCAPRYRSSDGYCAPIDERSAPAIPKIGQSQCPSGWTSSSHSCRQGLAEFSFLPHYLVN
jgi:hypothetical protein